MSASETTTCSPLRTSEYDKIRKLAYDTFGLDLRTGKETLVSTRLAKQIRQSGHTSFNDYYQHVVDDSTGKSLINLIDALTTNHTSFFREEAHFDFLRKTFLPERRNSRTTSIWSAACSSGEEPYTIAMCLAEELGAALHGKFRILATDISTQVLDKAKQGIIAPTGSKAFPIAACGRFGCEAKETGQAGTESRRIFGRWWNSSASISWGPNPIPAAFS